MIGSVIRTYLCSMAGGDRAVIMCSSHGTRWTPSRRNSEIHSFLYSSPLQTRHGGRVSVLWSRVRTFPHPRQRYLPLPGLSPDLYDIKREQGRGPIKVGCGGTESVGESADGTPCSRCTADLPLDHVLVLMTPAPASPLLGPDRLFRVRRCTSLPATCTGPTQPKRHLLFTHEKILDLCAGRVKTFKLATDRSDILPGLRDPDVETLPPPGPFHIARVFEFF